MPCKHPPPDYESIESAMWRDNAQQVVPRLNDSDADLAKRISTYIERFGYARETVEEKIRQDPMFAANFAKEPRRTSFHENAAAEWLGREMELTVDRLSPAGNNAFYITGDGMVVTGLNREERKPSKSLDFCWNTHGNLFYAMHKYTKEGGGNQDSQFREMQDLLRNFQGATAHNKILIVIVDGPYYTTQKMEVLQNLVRHVPPRSYAVPIEQVPSIIESYNT